MIATVAGASGLIGSYLLEQLLQDDDYKTVRILIRRPFALEHPKLEKKIVDFTDSDSLLVAISNSDVIFCSIGTTQKKVKGNKEAYRKIDYDIPVKIARLGKMTGCEKFVLVSSAGASSKSRSFYLKLKGEVEDAVKETGLRSVHIMRPSILLGDRKEFRLGEGIGKGVMQVFSFLLPSRYRPVRAKLVAKAMLAAPKLNTEGFFIYEYAAMKNLVK